MRSVPQRFALSPWRRVIALKALELAPVLALYIWSRACAPLPWPPAATTSRNAGGRAWAGVRCGRGANLHRYMALPSSCWRDDSAAPRCALAVFAAFR